jgi:predicted phosphodiesterase
MHVRKAGGRLTDPKLEALLAVGLDGPTPDKARTRNPHPQGWEPLVITEQGGYVTSPPQAEPPADWNDFLAQLLPDGMNPAEYEVDGATVEMRAWDGNVGAGELKRFYYFKARIRRRSALVRESLDDIIAVTRKARPKAVTAEPKSRTYFIQITDLQAGQADGDGVEGMVRRALEIPSMVKDDVKALAAVGKKPDSIFIPITGDLVEGISGWYEMQTFSVSLDRREQVKLVRRLLTEILVEIASLGLPVHVAVVPGNHGENRQNGKAYTTLGDNDDVAVVEQVAEAFRLSEKFSHVTFSFPAKNRLSLTVEVQGWIVGLTHGHIARAAGMPAGKILNWFKTMAGIRDAIGDSDLLFVGHYHHLILQQLIGDTLLVMGGALCDASDWFSQTAGLVSDPCIVKGTITRENKIETFMPYFWNRTKSAKSVV